MGTAAPTCHITKLHTETLLLRFPSLSNNTSSLIFFLTFLRAIQESLSISLVSREGEDMADPSQPSSVSPLDPTANSPLSYSAVTDPRLSVQFGVASSFDEQLRMAMELSCREQEEMDR